MNVVSLEPKMGPGQSRLWIWFLLLMALQAGAWTAWLTIASKNKVAEVPLAVSR